MSSALRRLSTGAAAWTVGAVASVAVSMLALTVIGGVGGNVQPPLPMPALDTGLTDAAASSDPASPSPSGTVTPSPSTPASARPTNPTPASTGPAVASPTAGPPRQFTTSGGVLTAQCTGQLAYLVSWSPAPGYRVDDVRRGPAAEARVTFENSSTHQEAALGVRCVSGVPRLIHVDG